MGCIGGQAVSENVKPCPFCGHIGISLAEGTTYRWRVAECSECGARCGEIRVQTSGAGTRQEWEAVGVVNAIEEWNKRTEPAELTKALRDAERYRSFRQLVKDDHVLAQGMVWNAHPSRKKFDKFVDFERGEKK
jgi:hypothetical protein